MTFFRFSRRPPLVLQMEAVECGAASLAMILGYYGRYESLETLRERCGVSRDGSNAARLITTASEFGLKGNAFKLASHDITTKQLPAIIFWENQHFLVLYRIRNKRYYLMDPAFGQRVVSASVFKASYSNVLITFSPTSSFRKKPRPKSMLSHIHSLLLQERMVYIALVLCGIAMLVPSILLPYILGDILQFVVSESFTSWLIFLLIGFLLALLMLVLFRWVYRRLYLRLEMTLSVVNSSRFLWHLLCLPLSFFTQRSTSDLMERIRINDDLISDYIRFLLDGFNVVLRCLVFGVIMFLLSPTLTFIIGGYFLAYFFIEYLFLTHTRRLYHHLSKESSVVAAGTTMAIQVIETLKTTGTISYYFSRWAGSYANMSHAQQRVDHSQLRIYFVDVLFYLSGLCLSTLLNLYALAESAITIQTFILLLFFSFYLMTSFRFIFKELLFLDRIKSRLTPLFDVYHYHSSHKEVTLPIDQKTRHDMIREHDRSDIITPYSDLAGASESLQGSITVDKVSFSFQQHLPSILSSLSFSIKDGETVLLLGPSGSGKSTCLTLLAGLSYPTSGTIHIGDQNLYSIPKNIRSESIAYISHKSHLFSGTVRDNITLGDPSFSEHAVIHAAKQAELHRCIMSRKFGYDALITEDGRNISRSEHYQFELARAFLRQPIILLIDDIFDAFDETLQDRLFTTIQHLGSSVIMCTRTPKMLKNATQILHLENGKITSFSPQDDAIQGILETGRIQ